MWEYRVVWRSPPEWWAAVWKRGGGVAVEERSDTYLVVGGRVDVGLKLRDEPDDPQFEAKVRLDHRHGWELWEKNRFGRSCKLCPSSHHWCG